MFTIKQDLRLHNGDQTIVLRNGSIASKTPCCFLDCKCRGTIGNAHHCTPFSKAGALFVVSSRAGSKAIKTLAPRFIV
nr:hypothetical protein Iba_chr02aCG6680 [Ipomoea batatas]